MIFTLIRNEYRKLVRKPKTWVIFGLFTILVAGMCYVSKLQSDDMAFYSSAEGQIEQLKQSIKSEQESLNDAKKNKDSESIKMCEDNIKDYKNQIKRLQVIIDNKDNPDYWKESLKEEKKNLKETMNDKTISEEEKISAEQRIDEINEYLDKDIKPIESWEFNAVNFAINFMEMLGRVILACGIAVFMSDIISGECTPPTLKFLLVQPISRGKVLLSKFIAVTTTVIGLIGGLEILAFLIIGIFTGFDAAKMPTLVGSKYIMKYANDGSATLSLVAGSGHYVSRGVFLLESFAFQMLFILACCAFVFLISSLFKSSMVTMAVSVISVVVISMITAMSSKVASIAHYIFLTYASPSWVISGDGCNMYNNPNITLGMGIVVLIVTTIICYVIAHIVFKKKDILI